MKSGSSSARIALLTPYTGGNLGDAAIQDAMIANLRHRLPDAQFSGISLNCENFLEQHGEGAFPLCATDRLFYGMARGSVKNPEAERKRLSGEPSQRSFNAARIKRALKRVPGLGRFLRAVYAYVTVPVREFRHCVEGYRFLRTQDLLIVSGGGQLDEEWGGAWGHPFSLFKWAVLAWIAKIPCAMASVGAQKTASGTSRLFLSVALRLACYRSYRDKHSKAIAAGLFPCAAPDPVVPDLAFSLPASELPPAGNIRSIAQGRTVIAVSPIAYAKPQNWPSQDRLLYERYLAHLAQVVSTLLRRDYFLVVVCSSLGDDESVIPELLAKVEGEFREQIHVPRISTWKDLAALLREVDILIASRLHSAILGFVSGKPTIAISFDPKVDWTMEDLGQSDYLLQIRNFVSEDVIAAIERIELRRKTVIHQIASYQERTIPVSAQQFEALVDLATARNRLLR